MSPLSQDLPLLLSPLLPSPFREQERLWVEAGKQTSNQASAHVDGLFVCSTCVREMYAEAQSPALLCFLSGESLPECIFYIASLYAGLLKIRMCSYDGI